MSERFLDYMQSPEFLLSPHEFFTISSLEYENRQEMVRQEYRLQAEEKERLRARRRQKGKYYRHRPS